MLIFYTFSIINLEEVFMKIWFPTDKSFHDLFTTDRNVDDFVYKVLFKTEFFMICLQQTEVFMMRLQCSDRIFHDLFTLFRQKCYDLFTSDRSFHDLFTTDKSFHDLFTVLRQSVT